MNGRLGMCSSCTKGKLKLKDDDGETVFCNGYFDEDHMARIPCYYTCKREDAVRLKPWFTKKPTKEENDEIDAIIGMGDSKSKVRVENKHLSELTFLAKGIQDKGMWELDSAPGLKSSAKAFVELCTGKLDLPSDTKKATMEIGKLILLHKANSAVEFVKILADKFGFLKENEDAKQLKVKSISTACNHAGNGPLMLAMVELSDLYYKEKNTNTGNTYKKVAEAIKNLDFEVNSKNSKGLGKGKTKVAGIGKGSSEKMHEFVTTGKIEKLEEKRACR